MFRKGSFISSTSGTRTLVVDNVSNFLGQTFPINARVIHAPPLGSGTNDEFVWQDIQVLSATRTGRGGDYTGTIQVGTDLKVPYGVDPAYDTVSQLKDFIAPVTTALRYTPSDYYQLNTDMAPGLFATAGVEYVQGPPQKTGPDATRSDFPFVADASTKVGYQMLTKWMVGSERAKAAWSPKPNLKAVCAFSKKTKNVSDTTILIGVNDGATSLTLIFSGMIEELVATKIPWKVQDEEGRRQRALIVNGETVAHEFTHHWRTNATTNWHCSGEDKVMEDHADKYCIMNTSGIYKNSQTTAQKWDAILGWHGVHVRYVR